MYYSTDLLTKSRNSSDQSSGRLNVGGAFLQEVKVFELYLSCIGGGAYEARRLVPPENLGP